MSERRDTRLSRAHIVPVAAGLLRGGLVDDGARPYELDFERQRVRRAHGHFHCHVGQAGARERYPPIAHAVVH